MPALRCRITWSLSGSMLETAGFRLQTQTYANLLRENNIQVDVYEIQDGHHFDIVLDMNTMSAEVTQAIVRQILSA